jgi:hypothetical protein
MVYAPGHFEQTVAQSRRRRFRSRREQLAVRFMAVLTVLLVVVTAFALTSRQARSGNGCIDFNYTTMIGGAETHQCGSDARALCATPARRKGIDGDFEPELYAACRKAGLPTGRRTR